MQQEIEWNGIRITVTHIANRFSTGHDHTELKTTERSPVTETGYRSHFLPAIELALFEDVEDFVRQ